MTGWTDVLDLCMTDVYLKLYGAIEFLPLQKLVLIYHAMFSLSDSHLDLSEQIIMTNDFFLVDWFTVWK